MVIFLGRPVWGASGFGVVFIVSGVWDVFVFWLSVVVEVFSFFRGFRVPVFSLVNCFSCQQRNGCTIVTEKRLPKMGEMMLSPG